MRHILAIEPDPKRAEVLRRLVHEQVEAHLVIAPSRDAALAAIAEGVPDVILASALLSPADEAELMSHVRQLPDAQHLQVLVTPSLADPDEVATVHAGMLSLFRRRRSRPACDPRAVGAQIRDYLELAHECRAARERDLLQDEALAHGADTDLGPEGAARDWPTVAATSLVVANLSQENQALVHHLADERRRAYRKTRQEVPWLSTITLPRGIDVQLLNISASGALVATSARVALGSPTEFRLYGSDTRLVVPARFVRVEVATVDPVRGVEYHAAAAFDTPVDLLDAQPRPAGVSSSEPTLRYCTNSW